MEIYAIIESGGKQLQVGLGDLVRVDKLELDGDKVVFDQVLLVQDGKNIKIGQPLVQGATVVATVIESVIKGEKIRIFRYKAKSRYRKTKGHRQTYTDLRITEIDGNKLVEKATKPKAPAKAKAKAAVKTKAKAPEKKKATPAKKKPVVKKK